MPKKELEEKIEKTGKDLSKLFSGFENFESNYNMEVLKENLTKKCRQKQKEMEEMTSSKIEVRLRDHSRKFD